MQFAEVKNDNDPPGCASLVARIILGKFVAVKQTSGKNPFYQKVGSKPTNNENDTLFYSDPPLDYCGIGCAKPSGMIYSTYFGGSGNEFSETHCLFVDHLGQAYVACGTGSNDIPTTPGVLKAQRSGTDIDGLFFKLSTDGSQLLACTYFGGLGNDSPEGLYVDSMQQLYVGCGSVSDDLPVTPGAFQTQRQGGSDGFVVKLDTAFSTALFCTYFGGSKNESVRAFHLGSDGTICLSGQTLSTNLPHTTNAFQTVHGSPNNNREDSYLAMFGLSALSGTSADDLKQNIQVYPNPATTQLLIDPAGARIQYFELLDGYGRLLKRFEDPGKSMDVQSLPSGLYWIRISLENSGFVVKKWVKA